MGSITPSAKRRVSILRVLVVKKLTTEQFIARAIEKHGDKYDYTETVYLTAKDKVKIRCKIHDTFFYPLPDNHTRLGSGCPLCGDSRTSDSKRISQEDFIRRATEVHGDLYDYSQTVYVGIDEKVKIRCKAHSTFFYQTPNKHINMAQGCKICHSERMSKSYRMDVNDYISRAALVHNGVYDYSLVTQFKNTCEKIPIQCSEHGIFYQSAANHLYIGRGCPICARTGGYSSSESGYFYVNLVGDNKALKVGITNSCPTKRAKQLNQESSLYIKNLYYFYHEDGKFIRELELLILRKFPTGVISRDIMKEGFTETVSVGYLPEIIDMVVYHFNNYKPA